MLDSSPYASSSKYYDLIYRAKDYKRESTFLKKLIGKFYNKKQILLLDVGCGTGQHLKYLAKSRNYRLVGLDADPEMLRIARNKLNSLEFVKGKMQNFSFKNKFDVITCLFSTIAYNTNNIMLFLTLKNFNCNLKKRGLLMFDIPLKGKLNKKGSWHFKFKRGNTYVDCYSKNVPKSTTTRYIINSKIKDGKRTIKTTKVHMLGMFTLKDLMQILKKAGFEVLKLYSDYNGNEVNLRRMEKALVISRKL